MYIRIKVSETMDKESGADGGYENRIIRIPKNYREVLGVSASEFIKARTKWGGLETLQVTEAFIEDKDEDNASAYVTSSTSRKLFMSANNTLSEVNIFGNLTLGCDPESFLVDKRTNEPVAAHRIMRKSGEVGHDGMLLEFRPNPSIYAKEVCDNLWVLIGKARQIVNSSANGKNIMIVGGSSFRGLTAGFHLHYGLPRGLLNWKKENKEVAVLLTRVLDYYIGVPAIIPEGNRDVYRRASLWLGYGKPSDHNLDGRTLEFRVPGGVNLVHPLLTIGLLTLGAVVVEDVVSRINACTSNFTDFKSLYLGNGIKDLYPKLPSGAEIFNMICTPDITLAANQLQKIKGGVREMVGYAHRAASIEMYFELLEKQTDFGFDIEKNWGDFYNEERRQG